jgi:hypothetical protein
MFMLPRRGKAFSRDQPFAAMVLQYWDMRSSERGLQGFRDAAAQPVLTLRVRDGMSRGMNREMPTRWKID